MIGGIDKMPPKMEYGNGMTQAKSSAPTSPAARKTTRTPATDGTAKRKRTTKAEQRAETIEQILDTAEYLFSRHGLYGVTLKDVA